MPKHEIKSCSRCQIAIECKAGTIEQCQCSMIRLTAEERIYIEERFTDCLCVDCLVWLTGELKLFKEKYIFR